MSRRRYDTFDAADEAAHDFVNDRGGAFTKRRELLIEFAETQCTPDVERELKRVWLGIEEGRKP